LAADFAVPVKSPLLAVMVTSAMGLRSSSRRKPLMLFWNAVGDGDGVGDGEVASDAGATTSRIASTEAETAPSIFSIPPRRFGGRPLDVLLKLKNLHLGGGLAAPLQPLRTARGLTAVLHLEKLLPAKALT
jgi:hypothetical protein